MKKQTYLKRMRSLDHQFLDRKISQSAYDTKRVKLTGQYSRSLKRKK